MGKWNFFDFYYTNPLLFRGYFNKSISDYPPNINSLLQIINDLDNDSTLCNALIDDAISMIYRTILLTKTEEYKTSANELSLHLKDLYSYTILNFGDTIHTKVTEDGDIKRKKFMETYSEKIEKKPRLSLDEAQEISDIIKVGINLSNKKSKQEHLNQLFK